MQGKSPKIAFGSGGLDSSSWVIFGGHDGASETQLIHVLDLETNLWSDAKPVKLDECLSCEQDRPVCMFERQQATGFVRGRELHVYGGISQSDVLADLLVIDIASGVIVHYENYGMYTPELPLRHPPPKYGAASSWMGEMLIFVGGMGSSGAIGNDVWVWDAETRTWSDTSVLRMPVHRTEATVIADGRDGVIVFGGSTNYVGELLLNDVWRFNTSTRRWSNLIRESRTQGPAGRAGAVGAVRDDILYIVGGRTSVRFNDDKRLWMFDLGTGSWSSISLGDALSRNERPFNRAGIQGAMIGSVLYLWGGELMMGLEDVERYSLVFALDMDAKKIERLSPRNVGPIKRKYHQMRGLNETAFLVSGGESFAGASLSDTWIFNTVTLRWTAVEMDGAGMSGITRSGVVGYTNWSVYFGGIRKDGKLGQIVQHDILRTSSSYVWTDDVFPSKISGHSVAGIGRGDIAVFGGSDESWTSNQVFLYKPGFCDPRGTRLASTHTASAMTDGSGAASYLSGSRCQWDLDGATHVSLETRIRTVDKLTVSEIGSDGEAQVLYTFKGAEGKRVFESRGGSVGFRIEFVSQGFSNDSLADEPCAGCDGFDGLFASCPSYSQLGSSAGRPCVCNSGFVMDNDFCVALGGADNIEGQSESVTGMAAGVAVGGAVVIVLGAYFHVHRRRLMMQIAEQDQKMYVKVGYNELVFKDELGVGSFGQVFRGEWRGTEVAIKRLTLKNQSKQLMQEFDKEIAIMVDLRHPNIVLYMGACSQPPYFCIISELMSRGSLFDVLHNSDIHLDDRTKLSFLLDAAKGMQYLHSSNPPILHRDLKSPNLLLNERGHLKISDFGLTGKAEEGESKEAVGSLLWMAPEVIRGEGYGAKADVYSYGIIMWEVFHRQEPYEGEDALVVAIRVSGEEQLRPVVSDGLHFSADLISLMKHAWSEKPDNRPLFSEIARVLVTYSSHSSQSSASFSSFSLASDHQPRSITFGVDKVLVSSHVCRASELWGIFPNDMVDWITKQNEVVRNLITRTKGYELSSENGEFLIVFGSIEQSLDFCKQVTDMLKLVDFSVNMHSPTLPGAVPNADPSLSFSICWALHTTVLNLHQESPASYSFDDQSDLITVQSISSKGLPSRILCSDEFLEKSDLDLKAKGIAHRTLRASGLTSSSTINELFLDGIIKEENVADRSVNILELDETHGAATSFKDTSSWKLDFAEISLTEEVLGSGSYGTVYLGKLRNQTVAVKKFTRQKMKERKLFSLISEIMILRDVDHPHIIKFLGACTRQPNMCIVIEYAAHGSLQRLVQDSKALISEQQKRAILYQIADAMNYLHRLSPPIYHRDLKSANVLVTSKEPIIVKVTDFGFARTKSDNQTMTKCGTQAWIAPEILKGSHYDGKADVYSYGLVSWEVESRRMPWESLDALRISTEVVSGRRPVIGAQCQSWMKDLIEKCWHQDVKKRPSFAEIMDLLKE
eukprot:TRINITY_DN3085_c0_g1_i2.p1 TRINITY_DN3085_c0_g1~~TRINITY_DN3085_c0_g1_i2.p1  ORF type:complete len:1462 (-),score=243.35 TRINITY_DN3085_c0_g1_i2:187-4572(-)